MGGAEHRPQEFFKQFDSSQEGNTLGEEGFPHPWQPIFDRIDSLRGEANLRAKGGLVLMSALVDIRLEEAKREVPAFFTGDDFLKAEYYEFSIAASRMGINLLEELGRAETEEEKDARELAYSEGAFIVAQEYLQENPDDPIAQRIMEEGLDAPFEMHQRFYRYIEHNIFSLINKYNPQIYQRLPELE